MFNWILVSKRYGTAVLLNTHPGMKKTRFPVPSTKKDLMTNQISITLFNLAGFLRLSARLKRSYSTDFGRLEFLIGEVHIAIGEVLSIPIIPIGLRRT